MNDFRKIAGLECYAPTDNVSELTARTNDEGWATVFEAWLRGSHLRSTDVLFEDHDDGEPPFTLVQCSNSGMVMWRSAYQNDAPCTRAASSNAPSICRIGAMTKR